MKNYITILVESIEDIVERTPARFFMSRRADGTEPFPSSKKWKGGTVLRMKNGEEWFHADDGSQPILMTDYNRSDLRLDEAPMLGRGMSSAARARDIEQSDREYIEQQKIKAEWRKMQADAGNPNKKWPGWSGIEPSTIKQLRGRLGLD